MDMNISQITGFVKSKNFQNVPKLATLAGVTTGVAFIGEKSSSQTNKCLEANSNYGRAMINMNPKTACNYNCKGVENKSEEDLLTEEQLYYMDSENSVEVDDTELSGMEKFSAEDEIMLMNEEPTKQQDEPVLNKEDIEEILTDEQLMLMDIKKKEYKK